MCRHDSYPLPVVSSSAQAGRTFLRRCFTDWNLLAMVEDAQLALTELITNAVQHAGPPVRASVSCADQMVEIAVSDGSTTLPVVRGHRSNLDEDLNQVLATEAKLGEVLDERDPRLHIGDAGTVSGGRGLLLIDALAHEWGVGALTAGKSIWIRSPAPEDWPHGTGCPCSTSSQTITLASGRSAVHRDQASTTSRASGGPAAD